MAITTSDKRRTLEDAKDASIGAQPATSLRDKLRSLEKAVGVTVSGGSIKSVSANGRTTEFSAYGTGYITPLEIANLYRELIDLFDLSKSFLDFCTKYDLDPQTVEIDGAPSPLPAVANANPNTSDSDVYDWMMLHLVAITEARSDFSQLRTGSGGVVI